MPKPTSLPGLPDDYTSQFFPGDLVGKEFKFGFKAKVMRCWADEGSDMEIDPVHAINRPLLQGEVGIADISNAELEIVPETELYLIQRDFILGDLVKRSLSAVESAVITKISSEVRLEHVTTGQKLSWTPYDKVTNALMVEVRDHVVYNNWIGTVEEVFEEALIQSTDGNVYYIAEMGGTLEPGRLLDEILPADSAELARLSEYSTSNTAAKDRIVHVRAVVMWITWNAINQQLPIAEQERYPEPATFWQGLDIRKLTLLDGTVAPPPAVGSTVTFRDESDDKAYGLEIPTVSIDSPTVDGTRPEKVPVRAMKIVEARTKLTLRWQDGTETEDWSTGLSPYHNVDEYECWPGDALVWRGDNGESRPACVQRFDPHQRVADIFLLGNENKERQTVSVIELDPGIGGPDQPHYGAAIGQWVLLCADNGVTLPHVPTIGQMETGVGNLVLRDELVSLAEKYAMGSLKEHVFAVPEGDPTAIDWWGQVTDLHLDGTLTIRLPSGKQRRLGLKNLQLLNEPMRGDMEDALGIMNGFGLDELVDDLMGDTRSDASWETLSDDQPGWDEAAMASTEDETESIMDQDEDDQLNADEVDRSLSEIRPSSPSGPEGDIDMDEPEAGPSNHATRTNGVIHTPWDDQDNWEQFQLLESAPEDHHFFREPVMPAVNKTYTSRLHKEHRALQSSLPENILVRTYEDRKDLMRVLIIGPEGTPYANAPFVFDIYLNPTKFPFEPPLVHFHSHTKGKGRCNPNLYEDGKVCLSILGTWSGEKSESWSPNKSSLLQVFVSISGLVLVRSPYHCEPAFAKLEGTKEGSVNSRLYSEKAYVLSRSFVRTALENPPAGLANELRHFYFRKGRLQAVIGHAQKLIAKGEMGSGKSSLEEEDAQMWNADAVGSLTLGAILTLKRTIPALEKMLLDNRSGSVL